MEKEANQDTTNQEGEKLFISRKIGDGGVPVMDGFMHVIEYGSGFGDSPEDWKYINQYKVELRRLRPRRRKKKQDLRDKPIQ